MSCPERDVIEAHDEYARSICYFLYIDGKGRNGYQHHTEAEYQEFLSKLSRSMFDTYDEMARYMGWID